MKASKYPSVRLLLRKLYWTDGDNISMANMDGSNQTTLFTNQKGPVGEQTRSLPDGASSGDVAPREAVKARKGGKEKRCCV